MLHETSRIGLTTELQCQLFFTNLGFNVSVPLGHDCRYDFILDIGNKLLKIQVKTATVDETGIHFSVKSSHMSSSGFVSHSYSSEEIDLFATYYNNKCYLIPVKFCGKVTKKLLFYKNSSLQQGDFIEDFEAIKIISDLNKDEGIINQIVTLDEKNQKQQLNIQKKAREKVGQFSLDDEFITDFCNFSEAARSIGVSSSGGAHISAVCKGLRKTAYGYIWKIITEE